MSIYQLYGTATSATDAVASLDVQFDGHIIAWSLSVNGSGVNAADEAVACEVSFLSTNMFNSNDARGVIASTQFRYGFTTSGAANASENTTLSGLTIPVVAGERIYLHIPDCSSTVTARCRAILYVADQADSNLRRRR